MLELTRRVGQSVQIGKRHTLTVLGLLPRIVTLQLTAGEEYFLSGPLKFGTWFDVEIDGYPLRIHALELDRGEARLGFDAPRELDIQRTERRTDGA